ncbi:hypothetical protein ACFTXM_49130 [Streptomyces sp. NPDC056930]|uniref:hypothetical protein n=1 Tax=Streptomyces sp. NPDC056930 TaxID=3345967 RepID=UPI00363076C6
MSGQDALRLFVAGFLAVLFFEAAVFFAAVFLAGAVFFFAGVFLLGAWVSKRYSWVS